MLQELKNTQHNRIAAQLRVHRDITDDLIHEGWDEKEASVDAFKQIQEMPVKNLLHRAAELKHSKSQSN